MPAYLRLVLACAVLIGIGVLYRASAEDPKSAKPAKTAPAKTEAKPNVKTEDLSKLSDEELKARLTPEQYKVCKQCGTEPPFRNAYWNNHEAGIYVDVISGEPLFASIHKYDSGTGWPSFYQPLKKNAVTEKEDFAYGMKRIEVKSAKADAHLGHLFDDGPAPTGLRYCINSASLKFIPKDKLKDAGLEEYLPLFEKTETAKK